MLEIATFETRRRLRGSLALAGLLSALATMMVAFYPSVEESGAEFETYIESLPPVFREAFGVEAFTTVEGFLAAELYQFGWVILLGLYFAYRAGALVSADVERGRMDLLLATPVSRARVVSEMYLSLLIPIVLVNTLTGAVVYGGLVVIGESIDIARLVAVHALSLPYLLACAAIGLVLSVTIHDGDTAQRAALGIVFALFMIESVTGPTTVDWLGRISPTYYYDPTAILVHGDYGLIGVAILLGAAVGFGALSREIFRRIDIA